MTTFLRQKRLIWYGHSSLKPGTHFTNKMLNVQVLGKRRSEARETMDGQQQGGHETNWSDIRARGRCLCHVITKAGPLLHGGGL